MKRKPNRKDLGASLARVEVRPRLHSSMHCGLVGWVLAVDHCAFAIAATLALIGGPAGAQQIRGRVVEDVNRRGLPDVAITLSLLDSGVVSRLPSGPDGFFTIENVPVGRYELVVERIGFASESRVFQMPAVDVTLPAFVLRSTAVPLDTLAAVVRQPRGDPTAVGFTRRSQIASGEYLARLERHGARLTTVVRELSGAHVREWIDRDGRPRTCVETRRRIRALDPGTGCEWVVVVLDGVALAGEPEPTFRTLQNVQQFESVTLMSGVDASQYGMEASARGALVLWTRGRGPHVDPKRN